MIEYEDFKIHFSILLKELQEAKKRFFRFFNDDSWKNEELFIHR